MATAFALDLEEARSRATEGAIEVARAEARSRQARGQRLAALSGSLPQVELFAAGSVGKGLTQFGFERPVASQLGLGVTGSWTLIDPSGWAAADAAAHSARGDRALLDWARVTARRDATLAVAALWSAQGELAAWDEAVVDARKARAGIVSLVDSGLRPPADGARAEADLATLEAQRTGARAAVVQRCAELQALLRVPVDGVCSLDSPEVSVAGETPGDHPALVAAEEALRAARSARGSTLLDHAPTVSATGTVGQYYAGDNSGIGWSAGVDARLPVFGSGGRLGADRLARAAKDDAELALEAQERGLAAARVTAEARWEAASAGLEARTKALEAAEVALGLVQERYARGLEGLEAWSTARRARDEARVTLAQARAEKLTALAELESVRGVW